MSDKELGDSTRDANGRSELSIEAQCLDLDGMAGAFGGMLDFSEEGDNCELCRSWSPRVGRCCSHEEVETLQLPIDEEVR